MSSIALNGVAKSWGDSTALHAVDLQIQSGSFCVLLGPSGCGKSTTLRIIAGLETATQGQVLIDGKNVTDLPPAQRGIAMVFQNYALFPHLSVADNITFGLSVRKVPAAESAKRLRNAAELLGLSSLLARRPGQLSGGQQQRVALGRALVAQATVCLMDEPLSNLDAQLRQDMRRELRELQQKLGLTVVYVTHDQTEAMSMADQVVLLNQGRVEQAGTPRELYARPATTFAARFIGTPPMNLVALEADGRIAGSDVASGVQATQLGVRPEAITLAADGVPAVVNSVEYLGADLVLRCAVGSEVLLVRAAGQHAATPGERVHLRWAADEAHGFGADGRRIH
ncbi:ABC transporter ATP-binding protein [Variovorax guangxiensis]|uniref:ABC transporter ATP-binding protein n=1 Tax=Variovorax guangxiensis TaxID=1775474 RepID=A0A502DQJ1_9BURK|nr:ABC transporter ATP-binding protein [Variovorax guangxiensis]RZI65405.1 MAG: ABC transporter ATP-binding protein [Variovorax sp.]TPG23045.1 ABC transporter ATP-binding protein [Variovorax ginsengisoli]TPG27593.1 ABC transporter ATP-binding protein [Variovorax guangxiensis]